ncbi:MAG: alginate export family protein [Aquirufa sp.]
MSRSVVVFLILCVGFCSNAQNIARLRFEDDFSYLKSDTTQKSWDERLKFMPLGNALNVSIGGEWREQYQNYTNANFGQFPASFTEESPHQWMHRMMLHADFRLRNSARIFVQLNNTTRSLNPNPITSQLDENKLAVHQWFLESNLSKHWLLRAGRQEMMFGQERFVATKEGPNTRQSFLGLTAEGKYPGYKLDAFYVKPVRMNVGVFDDGLMDEEFGGIYAVKTDKKRQLNVDAYYFYFESTQREYVFKKGLEQRHTAGLRVYSPLRKLNYDVELSHQWGRFNALDISAWMLVWDFNIEAKKHFYVGFSGNYVPGDESATDQSLNTFNTLFARPPFGQTVALNITNTLNLSPYLRYQAGSKWLATARASLVSRTSEADGIFTPNMSPLRPLKVNSSSTEMGICDIYALDINYVPTKHYFFQAELGFCQAGSYLKDSGPGKDVVYFAIRNAIKF